MLELLRLCSAELTFTVEFGEVFVFPQSFDFSLEFGVGDHLYITKGHRGGGNFPLLYVMKMSLHRGRGF